MMSVAAVRAVLERSRSRGSARLVLLVIAEHADALGLAWPGVPLIAREAAISERHVPRQITTLIRLGEITIQEHPRQHRSRRYKILLPGVTPMSPLVASTPGVTSAPPGVTSVVAPGVTSGVARGDTHVTLTGRTGNLNHHGTTGASATRKEDRTGPGRVWACGEQERARVMAVVDRMGQELPASQLAGIRQDAARAAGLEDLPNTWDRVEAYARDVARRGQRALRERQEARRAR